MGAAARSPVVIVILEFLVGALVSHGIIAAEHQQEVVGLVADLIGALMYVVTALFALHRFFDYKKHHVSKEVELHTQMPEVSYSGLPDVITEGETKISQVTVTSDNTSTAWRGTFTPDPTPTIIGDKDESIDPILDGVEHKK